MRRRIAEEWDGFAAAVIPGTAPPQQLESMRDAFYGGFAAFVRMSREVPDDNEEQFCEDIETELQEFGEELAMRIPERGSA